jgi:hypothetical protein
MRFNYLRLENQLSMACKWKYVAIITISQQLAKKTSKKNYNLHVTKNIFLRIKYIYFKIT